jgi:hypothetical protein
MIIALSLARATHHIRLVVPNGAIIHHWRGWSKDKRGRLEARWCPDGVLIANVRADHRVDRRCVHAVSRPMQSISFWGPMSAQWIRVRKKGDSWVVAYAGKSIALLYIPNISINRLSHLHFA